jgi:phage tail sheath gpL-like
MEQIDGTAFAAFRGNHSESTTFGNSRNWHGICTMGTNLSPQYPPLWAATVCASAASALAIDPARPLQTLRLRSLLPPAAQLRWRRAERDVLLHNGVSTYRVGDDGTVTIERLVTMYQKNAQGYEDAAYLDLNTVETLRRIRMRQRQHIGSTYPRHKLAADGTDYPSGQPIVTPSLIKGALIALYQEFIDLGWVEDLDGYQETLHVEIDADDKNRVNFVDNPNLINQFRILAGKTQFEV